MTAGLLWFVHYGMMHFIERVTPSLSSVNMLVSDDEDQVMKTRGGERERECMYHMYVQFLGRPAFLSVPVLL